MDCKISYLGMTVNERLHVSGYSDKYHEAVETKNVDAAISILKAVNLGEENINVISKLDGLTSDDMNK
jgi:hypothetical protein